MSRELDALIAEKVMGWVWKRGAHYDITSVPQDKQLHLLEADEAISDQIPGEFTSIGEWPPEDGRIIWSHLPHYSTDISAAWDVIDALAKTPHWIGVIVGTFGIPHAKCYRDNKLVAEQWIDLNDIPDTRSLSGRCALAICLAALKAVGVEL